MRSEPKIEELFVAISNFLEDIASIVEGKDSNNSLSNLIIERNDKQW